MTTDLVAESFPEWEPFARAVQERHPSVGTWCEAWTVRDIVVHQAGTAEELRRVLHGHLVESPVPTRGFEEREAPYRSMTDGELWAALAKGLEELARTCRTAVDERGQDEGVAWTGRTMKVAWFAEHMREELVLHRWDVTGSDAEANRALAEPWMTDHSVVAVGRPLLARGLAAFGPGQIVSFEGRLRSDATDDVLVAVAGDQTTIAMVPPDGPATIESDAATRCLFLWGRRPADPSTWRSTAGVEALRRLRQLLSGY
jgi:hypothetical protein